MSVTSIEWTDRTWNPVRGCSRVSEGCRNCYAERMASRGFDWAKGFATMTPAGPRWTGKVALIPELLDEPLRWKKPQRVFVNSMSDLFHEALPFEDIAKVFERMAWGFRLVCRKQDCSCECEHDVESYGGPDGCRCWREIAQHTYQVLTKRPGRMVEFFTWLDERDGTSDHTNGQRYAPTLTFCRDEIDWPLENVWLGVSVEDQATADERIPLLLQTPAAVRFVSYEPALGPVEFRPFMNLIPHFRTPISAETGRPCGPTTQDWIRAYHMDTREDVPSDLHWVIVGGESGHGARPFDVAWARSTVAQCKAASVPVFVKQMGHWITGDHEDFGLHSWLLEDGRGFIPPIIGERAFARPENAIAFTLGGKGGDMAEWPQDLRIRDFPKEAP